MTGGKCVIGGGRWRAGFTLVELVMSMAIVSICCIAVLSVSTLLLRANSAAASTGMPVQNAATREAMDRITTDVKMATTITERTATSLAFTVPDRDGDGAPETIRYSWAGSGAPLLRQYNGQTAVQVLPSAQTFALSYVDQTVQAPPPADVTSVEQQLFAYDDASASGTQNLKDTNWAAQTFKPVLPANAISWSITRVRIEGKRNNNSIFYAVEVRALDGSNKATGSALASVSFSSSTLSNSATWIDLYFPTPASGLLPAAGYAIVVRGTNSGTNAIALYYDSSASVDATRGWTTTSNSGTSWTTPANNKAMQIYVYGTVTTPS
jgi:prepilin-type N-terminal cleavage/methylation domain-containing protein